VTRRVDRKNAGPKPKYSQRSIDPPGLGRLLDKVALITGGDSGIGRAEAGRASLALPGDITDEAHCQRIADETFDRFGRIDVLVSNADARYVTGEVYGASGGRSPY
jgi:NAD(P)-dependent dehydrogenase (short-subunit alcohol dehydrogenase family)